MRKRSTVDQEEASRGKVANIFSRVEYVGARSLCYWRRVTATHHSSCFMAASAKGDNANR